MMRGGHAGKPAAYALHLRRQRQDMLDKIVRIQDMAMGLPLRAEVLLQPLRGRRARPLGKLAYIMEPRRKHGKFMLHVISPSGLRDAVPPVRSRRSMRHSNYLYHTTGKKTVPQGNGNVTIPHPSACAHGPAGGHNARWDACRGRLSPHKGPALQAAAAAAGAAWPCRS